MKKTFNSDVRLAYTDQGISSILPPIVFVHGWGCDHTVFAQQIDYFAASTRVISVDLRGHGESEAPAQEYSISGFADDLAWLCQELQLENALIVGHSMGGNIGLEAAAKHPDAIGSLILIDSVLFPPAEMAIGAEALFEALAGPKWLEAYQAGIRGLCLATDEAKILDPLLSSLPKASQQVLLSSLIGLVRHHDAAAAAHGCRIPVAYIGASNPMGDVVTFKKLTPQLVTAQVLGAGHFCPNVVSEQVTSMIQRFIEITG